MIKDLMVNERKIGDRLGNDIALYYHKGDTLKSSLIDFSHITQQLTEMFGVYEFEFYFPQAVTEIELFDLNTPVDKNGVLDKHFDDFLRLFPSFLRRHAIWQNKFEHENLSLKELTPLKFIERTVKKNATYKDVVKYLKLAFDHVFHSYTLKGDIVYKLPTLWHHFNDVKQKLINHFKGTFLEQNLDIECFPGEKETMKNPRKWYIESDESVSSSPLENYIPVEVVSPRIPYIKTKELINVMGDFYKKHGIKTTEHTGFHVNIGFNKEVKLDLIKLIILGKEDFDLKQYERSNNEYCLSQFKRILTTENVTKVSKVLEDILKKQVDAFNEEIQRQVISERKYNAININKWLNPYPGLRALLEFRIMGGSGYLPEKTEQAIKNTLTYFYTAFITADEKLYRKEYLTKLYKLIDFLKQRIQADTTPHPKPRNVQDLLELLTELVQLSKKNELSSYEINMVLFPLLDMNPAIISDISETDSKKIVIYVNTIKRNHHLLSIIDQLIEQEKGETILKVLFSDKLNIKKKGYMPFLQWINRLHNQVGE